MNRTRGGRVFGNALLVIGAMLFAHAAARRALATEGVGHRPPATLTETGLYEEGRPGVVAARNRPFSPQYPLWTDGASKARWVYLPPGAVVDATNVDAWDFPVGTRFWKEFAFNGRKAETRMLWKTAPGQWVFGSYVWNEAGTEAVLAPDEGIVGVADVGNGRRHSVPSLADCRSCHDAKRTEVLGFNALQLSTDRDPGAIHGEPLAPGMVTLRTLVEEGTLVPRRAELVTNPPRIRASSPTARSVLGYLASNCGHCHNADTDVAQLGRSLRHADVTKAGDHAAARMAGHKTAWQVPGAGEGESVLVDLRAPEMSALLVRMRSRRPSSQMPPVGTVTQDDEALDAIRRWIETEFPR